MKKERGVNMYRVVKVPGLSQQSYYEIRRVYEYGESNNIGDFDTHSSSAFGYTIKELKDDMMNMLIAFDKDVIVIDDYNIIIGYEKKKID
jgi:hypothetical protein